MDKHLQECLSPISREVSLAVMNKKVSGAPFVDFTSDAMSIFLGFETIVELLQIDLLREGEDEEEDRRMTDRQKEALLGLIRVTSQIMEYKASDISEWARKRLADKGAGHD